MNVLFVCKNNVARSQIAKAIFNQKSNKHTAQSAGTNVMNNGETLKQRADKKGGSLALSVMDDKGYNIGEYKQTQLTKDALNNFDLVVNMSAKRYTPKWLSEYPNYIYWKIKDPKNISYQLTDSVSKQIELKVTSLITKLG